MFFFITIQNALKHSTIFFFCNLLFFCVALRLLLMSVFQFFCSQKIFLSTFHSFLLKKFVSEALMSIVLEERAKSVYYSRSSVALMVMLPVKHLDWKGVQDCICTVLSSSVWKKTVIAFCLCRLCRSFYVTFHTTLQTGILKLNLSKFFCV